MADDQPKNAGAEPSETEAHPIDVMELVRTYARPVLVGAALAAAITVGTSMLRSRARRATAEASRMLLSGRPEQMEALIRQYAKAPAAPIARLALARNEFHEGKYEAAEKRYAEFAAAHPDHPFAVVAEINRLQCVEARGLITEAMTGFEAVAARKDIDPLFADVARIGRARCLEQLGRYDEAIQIYEEYVAAQPNGPWIGAAETALQSIESKKRAARAAAVMPAVKPASAPEAKVAKDVPSEAKPAAKAKPEPKTGVNASPDGTPAAKPEANPAPPPDTKPKAPAKPKPEAKDKKAAPTSEPAAAKPDGT